MLPEVLNEALVQVQDENKSSSSRLLPHIYLLSPFIQLNFQLAF